MTIPNYAQTSRIRFDIQAIQNGRGDTVEYWHGNSYKGIPETLRVDGHRIWHGIRLMHWDTTIAIISAAGAIYFDARYVSATTRGFQGRILNAMRTAFGENHPTVIRIAAELSMPTDQRGVLDWRDSGTR